MKPHEQDAIEIAKLAVRLLPAIQLPKNWESADGHELLVSIARASTDLYRVDLGDGNPRYLTKWEIISNEAVQRAKALVAISGDPEALQRLSESRVDRAYLESEESILADEFAEVQKWASKFESRFGAGAKVPVEDTLSIVMGRVAGPTRAYYFKCFLEERRLREIEGLVAKGMVADIPPTKTSLKLREKLGSWEFGNFAASFDASLKRNKHAWQKRRAREIGAKGGRVTQRKKKKRP